MSEILAFALTIVVGWALGYVYCMMLWAGVRRLPSARHPVALMVGGLVARLGVAVVILFLALRAAGPIGVLLTLAGFLAGRYTFTRLRVGQQPDSPAGTTGGSAGR